MADTPKKTPAKKQEAAPAPARPLDPVASLRQQIDRLFEDFSANWPAGPLTGRGWDLPAAFRGWPTTAPAVDLVDLGKEVQIRAELPGLDEKDIEIELAGNLLTIRGEKKEEKEEGKRGSKYYLSERRYGSFERSLRLPEEADCAKPEASFAKGVLTVTFPKTKAAQETPKKVKIKNT